MINYELAKQLKDAGFPQDLKDFTDIWISRCEGEIKIDVYDRENKYLSKNELYFTPKLSQLIEACGDKFYSLVYALKDDWRCFSERDGDYIDTADGKTPEEAVAKLWLELNK